EAILDLVDILNGLYGVWSKITQWASFTWGAIIGDFNKEPTLSQTIISSLISLIPVADQVSDIRDLVANVLILTDDNGRENSENWFNLALTAIGVIPTIGSALKSLVKIIRHKEVKDINALKKIMETCESYLRRIGAGDKIPWGDNPIAWLQTKPWQSYAEQAKNHLKQYLERFSYELTNGYQNVPAPLQTKMTQLATQIDDIASQINKYIDEILEQTQLRIDELFDQSNLAVAMNGVANTGDVHKIHVGGNPNTPTKVTQQQPSQTIFTRVMRPKKVGCFDRVNTDKARERAKQNIKNDHPPGSKNLTVDEYLDKETDWQLKLQQDGINSMTVEDYEKGRNLFRTQGRGNGSDQQKARDDYEEYLLSCYTDEYTKAGVPDNEIEQKAKATTDNVMKTLAALHNPDQIVGGANSNIGMDMGLKNVNSSIGSQWKNIPKDDTIDPLDQKLTRVDAIDKAVENLPDKSTTRMNVQLERCK
ncbi:MAG: polymorphic toxin type 15 domain-containing protein, partial [Moraxella sp.]|nr:polymorphic toxin type 15 domain-containing protein [Moraxella sp.]